LAVLPAVLGPFQGKFARLKVGKSVIVQAVKATQSRLDLEFFFARIGGYKKIM
jgi:hypothetical protein